MAIILVVDDRAIDRELLVTLLGYYGHCIIEAGDGMAALERARVERPELIITDILMPTMDGYEFVRQVRTDPSIANAAIIFWLFVTFGDSGSRRQNGHERGEGDERENPCESMEK